MHRVQRPEFEQANGGAFWPRAAKMQRIVHKTPRRPAAQLCQRLDAGETATRLVGSQHQRGKTCFLYDVGDDKCLALRSTMNTPTFHGVCMRVERDGWHGKSGSRNRF